MTHPLVVIGAGGFGRETLDVVDAVNRASAVPPFHLLGVVDDRPSDVNLERLQARGVKHLGAVTDWLSSGTGAAYIVAIGSPVVRSQVVKVLDRSGAVPATLVHPSAVVGSQNSLGAGSVVCAGVNVSTNVSIGAHVHLNPAATIGHDTVLHDFVSVNPAATVSGECVVESCALVGAAAVVLQGLTVGECSTVGAAACVVRDVPSGRVVKGVPAR